jgi:hypothetical protein
MDDLQRPRTAAKLSIRGMENPVFTFATPTIISGVSRCSGLPRVTREALQDQ